MRLRRWGQKSSLSPRGRCGLRWTPFDGLLIPSVNTMRGEITRRSGTRCARDDALSGRIGFRGCAASLLRTTGDVRKPWCYTGERRLGRFRMVIAHVIDSMDVGGAEAVVAALCRLQMAAGHTVSVHCLLDKGAVAEQLESEGVRLVVHGPASTARILWRLYWAFRALQPAVVHCHNKSATVHAAA